MPGSAAAQKLTPQQAFDTLIRRWFDEPVLFVQEALGVTTIARWQREALEAVVTHDRLAIRSGHGVGKTTFIAWVILWWELTRRPNKCAVTANRQDQLSDIVWAEIRLWAARLHPDLRDLLEITSDKVSWKGAPDEAFAVARTARKEAPEAFQGFHSAYMLFIADEASGIDDVIFEVGQGAMSTAGAKTILTGNPTRTQGYFYNAFHKSSARWWRRKVSCLEVIEEGIPWASRDFPLEIAEEWGEDSNRYRYRVLGEFATDDDEAVIPRSLITGAIGRQVEASGRIVWGVDVARFGDDRSAVAKRWGNVMPEPVISWKGRDVAQTAGRIIRMVRETDAEQKPELIMVDSIGVGAGVLDILRDAGLPARGVNVGEVPANRERFARLRDELWWKMRLWFEARDVCIPDDGRLVGELSAVHYGETLSGKIKVESKDEMRARSLVSPDLADALMMTFAGQDVRRRTQRRLEVVSSYSPHSW